METTVCASGGKETKQREWVMLTGTTVRVKFAAASRDNY